MASSKDEGAPPAGGERSEPDFERPPFNPAGEVASIVRTSLEIWEDQIRRWYARSTVKRTWSPEDVVGDSTNLIENFNPLAERSIDLTLGLLRPWARAIRSQR